MTAEKTTTVVAVVGWKSDKYQHEVVIKITVMMAKGGLTVANTKEPF